MLAGSCKALELIGGAEKAFNFIACTAKISNGVTILMFGFDIISLADGLRNPSSSLFEINQSLHENKVYNIFQFSVAAIASFSGGAYFEMTKGNPACFVAGTLVATVDGLKAIESIKVGDLVLSANTETMQTDYRPVLETYVRNVDKLVHLTVTGEEIITTVDHPFYVNGQGFVHAIDLCIGSELVNSSGEIVKVENIFRESLNDDVETVYNFKVDEWHTYFVGNNCILVHNAEQYGNGHYEHNPSDDPKVLKDAVEDPEAVYGYRPNAEGSLKRFANGDWTNPEAVEGYRQARLEYIREDKGIIDLVSEMKKEGYSITDIAKKACEYRNNARLQSYVDSAGNITNPEGYAAALERMQTRSYEALISSGKTPKQIIESSVRTNPAMDACVGFYDENYNTYNH